MFFCLNNENVFDYLVENEIHHSSQPGLFEIVNLSSKNFNLKLSIDETLHYLVKQERFVLDDEKNGEFVNEWNIQELLNTSATFKDLQPLMSEVLFYDAANAIIVLKYDQDYFDIAGFYKKSKIFPPQIAASVGQTIATIHKASFNQSFCQNFFSNSASNTNIESVANFLPSLRQLTPGVFGTFCPDGIEFLKLFQRHKNLQTAIASLAQEWQPSCLIHGDFRLYNILLHQSWETTRFPAKDAPSIIKIIDWERGTWGDPCLDIATILGNYLSWWLDSMLIHPALPLDIALKTAKIPLEILRPSLIALMTTYLQHFPEVLQHDPQWFSKIMKLIGVYLIERILAQLEEHEPFDNIAIAKLQVASRLLCQPIDSIQSIFGVSASELIPIGTMAA